jgi:hypothetical protein
MKSKMVFIITLVIYIIFTSVYQLMQQAEMLAGWCWCID